MSESKSRDKITSTLGSINGTNLQVRPAKLPKKNFNWCTHAISAIFKEEVKKIFVSLKSIHLWVACDIFNGFDDSLKKLLSLKMIRRKLNKLFFMQTKLNILGGKSSTPSKKSGKSGKSGKFGILGKSGKLWKSGKSGRSGKSGKFGKLGKLGKFGKFGKWLTDWL